MEPNDVPTSDRILKTAGQLFLDRGFDSVSTDEVAEATGVTKAMIYYYFSSKADLFTASMVRIMKNIQARTKEILAREGTLYERLLQIAKIRLAVAQSHQSFDAIVHSAKGSLTINQVTAMKEEEEGLMDILQKAFAVSQAEGEIGNFDTATLAHLYVAALSAGEAQRRRMGTDGKADGIAETMMNILWHGIGCEGK